MNSCRRVAGLDEDCRVCEIWILGTLHEARTEVSMLSG